MRTNNSIARLLFVLGILEIIAGFIAGIVFGRGEAYGLYGSYYEFSWSLFFIIFLSSLIAGLIVIGFGEVIRLLQDIKDQTKDREL